MKHINQSVLRVIISVFILVALLSQSLFSQEKVEYQLQNPVTAEYLRKNLQKQSPKLILTPAIEKRIKQKLKADPLVKNYFQYLKKEADLILEKPLLERELEGFRLLFVSREMVERMTILCMVYRLEKDPEILKRIDAEINAVCNFSDWNPQHFLDVAEMSFGVALAVDWAGGDLPKETVALAKKSLIGKGINESFNEENPRMFWINSSNNWNAVCHGGMVAASLVVADINPELAAKTISRALEKLPNSLKEYAPDGVYPEGPGYWGYGTSYTVIAASVLESALGTDFGISQSPGFLKSADFYLQTVAPSGEYFNFADSDGSINGGSKVLLTWFAAKTGDALYFRKEFYENPEEAGRFAGPALVWLAQYSQEKKSELQKNWHGRGANPVAVFRGDQNDSNKFYLAAKGGKAQLSHGNMDAGSFVFELHGVRWVIDPGNQRYYLLNKIGFNLAGHCQECPRWTLLTKKNQGHSTITVNDERFDVSAKAEITNFKAGVKPEVTIDMTRLYFDNLNSLQRRFIKENNQSVLIEDEFEINDSTKNITWGLMTVADVIPSENGAILKQDGKELHISIFEPEGIKFSVIALDPPPLEIDKTIKNLKRLEIRIPAWTVKEHKGKIKVKLSGSQNE
jgi:hypothetical protein